MIFAGKSNTSNSNTKQYSKYKSKNDKQGMIKEENKYAPSTRTNSPNKNNDSIKTNKIDFCSSSTSLQIKENSKNEFCQQHSFLLSLKNNSSNRKGSVHSASFKDSKSGRISHKKQKSTKKKGRKNKTYKYESKRKFKTEPCKFFASGNCKFGDKCIFAHGKEELRVKTHINLHYKSKLCNQFFQKGFCPYGTRCQYLHKIDYDHIYHAYIEKLNLWVKMNPKLNISKIMTKTHVFTQRLPIALKLSEQNTNF